MAPAKARPRPLSNHDARRLALAGADLLRPAPARVDAGVVRRRVERLGAVQVDSIDLGLRAHHQILLTRLPGYRPAMLRRVLEDQRTCFEHWTHDAAVVPVRWFGHWRHRFDRDRDRIPRGRWWSSRLGDRGMRIVGAVHERVRAEGPLMTADVDADRNGRAEPWWGWGPEKAALEFLWRTGELAVARRVGFQKVYDLIERVLPDALAHPASDPDEHVEWAAVTGLAAIGTGTSGEIAAQLRAVGAEDVRRWAAGAIAGGRVVEVLVEPAAGGRPRRELALTESLAALDRLPEPPEEIRLLSPFDPIVRDRARASRLFGFDYRFEAFVPAAKRVHGYYVLPLLAGDRMIGRLEPRLDRASGTVRVERALLEPGAPKSSATRRRLEGALWTLAEAVGASAVELRAIDRP